MKNDVEEDIILYETAQEVCNSTRKTYSNKEDTTKVFGIEGIIHLNLSVI